MRKTIQLFFLFLVCTLFAQQKINKKSYQITRVSHAPIIDGNINDDAWKNANIATDFVMFRPGNGEPIPDNLKTDVKLVYDDKAIYVAAYLHNNEPQKIPMEFSTRDNFGQADFFVVTLNPFNDGINQTEFFVFSTGNQADAKISSDNEDFSWNAVWESKVKMTDDGWIAEIKIPYAALRFSDDKEQIWGLNFHRRHQINRDQYTWNYINRKVGSIAQYDGVMTGLKDIKPPVRLSFNPFISAVVNDYQKNTTFNWSAGLDVKYGINESFTLDATLVPDFGQVAFDNVTLNLGPFEQFFSEQRAFFTEGTDLFSKGDFFYSRRVGSSPIGNVTLANNEELVDYPDKVATLNAVKLSGRTKKGLGIGVFNGITEKTYAKIKNTEDNTTRETIVEPLANYNVLVLDQQFNKNSSVTLVNTDVLRNGHFRDANVTGLLFDLKTKNNKYGLDGGISSSNIFENDKVKTGFEGNMKMKKISGNHQYGLEYKFMNDKYDKNDLGFQRKNNYQNIEATYNYRIFKPKGKFNSYGVSLYSELKYLYSLDNNSASYAYRDKLYTGNNTGMNVYFTTKKQLSFGTNINFSIGDQYDYFEPRVEGRFFKGSPPDFTFNYWISTNYTKKFAFDANIYYGLGYENTKDKWFGIHFSPRYRFSNKLNVIYSIYYDQAWNIKGYVNTNDDQSEIYFGNRDYFSLTNALSAKYNFGVKSALTLSFRHYWSPVTYDKQFSNLELDGTLSNSSYTNDHDVNYNTWNVDLNYSWQFAPGSQLIALYRNSIFSATRNDRLNISDNFNELFNADIRNNFSLKLIYYLDYNSVKSLL